MFFSHEKGFDKVLGRAQEKSCSTGLSVAGANDRQSKSHFPTTPQIWAGSFPLYRTLLFVYFYETRWNGREGGREGPRQRRAISFYLGLYENSVLLPLKKIMTISSNRLCSSWSTNLLWTTNIFAIYKDPCDPRSQRAFSWMCCCGHHIEHAYGSNLSIKKILSQREN